MFFLFIETYKFTPINSAEKWKKKGPLTKYIEKWPGRIG